MSWALLLAILSMGLAIIALLGGIFIRLGHLGGRIDAMHAHLEGFRTRLHAIEEWIRRHTGGEFF